MAASTLRELGRRLRDLAESSPRSASDLAAWQSLASDLERELRRNPQLCDLVPHFVWHYLADADLRVEDDVHRSEQQAAIFDIISALERGELPRDDA